MANFQDEPPSFFMLYTKHFSTKLSIPLEFGIECNTFLRQASLKLIITHARRSWAVKAKNKKGKWYINDGWSKFATDNHLVAGNLLTFRVAGFSALEVSVFRQGSCMEEPPSPPPSPPASAAASDDEERPAMRWRFVKKLKHYHFTISRMEVPSTFAWATGISTRRDIELVNGGRRWPIKITDRNINVFSMTAGWVEFVRAAEFRVGDILLFEFMPDSGNVVKVVQLEKKLGKKLVAAARKGGLIMD